jgi:phospholipid-translocating ATPase
MGDGIYQSVICFFMAYLEFAPATFVTNSGRGVADTSRMGVYVACATIIVANTYVLLNTYRWDWLILLIVTVSTLLIFFWTGVYSSFKGSFQFYKAGAEVYGELSFWVLTLLTVIICLLPRFSVKFFQKNYRPLDIDIIREQVRQGKFRYLDQYEAYVPPSAKADLSGSSSASPAPAVDQNSAPINSHARADSTTESSRPIYPPSEAPTGTTRNPRSQNGSDGTDQTRASMDVSRTTVLGPLAPPNRRPSLERVGSSFERSRKSFDRVRPSFEGSRDFTSAALLTRMESSQSHPASQSTPSGLRHQDNTSDYR